MQDSTLTLTKKENNKMMKVILDRIKETKLVKKNEISLNETVYRTCKSQASLIDACMRNRLTVIETANKLVEYQLCFDIASAIKRIKRHANNDKKSRVEKRNIELSNNNATLQTNNEAVQE